MKTIKRANKQVGEVSKQGRFWVGHYMKSLKHGATQKMPVQVTNLRELQKSLKKVGLTVE